MVAAGRLASTHPPHRRITSFAMQAVQGLPRHKPPSHTAASPVGPAPTESPAVFPHILLSLSVRRAARRTRRRFAPASRLRPLTVLFLACVLQRSRVGPRRPSTPARSRRWRTCGAAADRQLPRPPRDGGRGVGCHRLATSFGHRRFDARALLLGHRGVGMDFGINAEIVGRPRRSAAIHVAATSAVRWWPTHGRLSPRPAELHPLSSPAVLIPSTLLLSNGRADGIILLERDCALSRWGE